MLDSKNCLKTALRASSAASAAVAVMSLFFWEAHAELIRMLLLLMVSADAVLLAIAAKGPSEPREDEPKGIEGIALEFGLSPRESDVLEAYARNRDIGASADELFISSGTVKSHLSHIYAKVGVSKGCELLRLCDSRMNRVA